ncbi:MAG: OstA-like protein [Ignavibacteriota bacterium]
MQFFAASIALLGLVTSRLHAQDKFEITADVQIGSGDKIRLVGHFHFHQGSIFATADSAIQYPAQNLVDLYGNVVIRQDTLSVEAPFVHYDGNSRIARGNDGVKFSDREANITSKWATYDMNLQRADFHEFVRAKQGKTILTSNDLTYFRSTQTSIAKGNVFVISDSGTLHADEVTNAKTVGETIARGSVDARSDSLIILSEYLYESKPLGLLTASGNVQAYSIANNTIQYGDTLARFSKLGYMIVPVNPLLLIIDSSEKTDSLTGKHSIGFDTLRIRSRIMEAWQGDSAHFLATDSVRLQRTNFSAIGTKLYYAQSDGIMRIFGGKKQTIWYDSTEINGDSIVMFQKEKKIDRIITIGHAFATDPYKDSTVHERMNQLSSQEMTLYVVKDTVRKLLAVENALSIYFITSDNKPSGFNRSSGDSLRMDFRNNEVERVAVLSGTEGEFWPERFVKDRGKAFRLGNYERHWESRPRSEDLMLSWKPKEFTLSTP